MVATDLDGTLLGGTTGRYGFRSQAVEALGTMAAQGGIVALVTGREHDFIEQLLEREGVRPGTMGWPRLLIAEERFIYHLRGDRFEPDEAWNRKARTDEASHFEEIRDGVADLLKGPLARVDPTSRRVEREKEEGRGFVEVLFDGAAAARRGENVLRDWLTQTGLPYRVVRNVAGVTIRHKDLSKGAVLARVADELGVARKEVLAIGDSCNDMSMLDGKLGFTSACPANAEPEVRDTVMAAGGYVALGEYGDGVAEAIAYHEEKLMA